MKSQAHATSYAGKFAVRSHFLAERFISDLCAHWLMTPSSSSRLCSDAVVQALDG